MSPEETDKLVPLSLGEYMFSQNAQSEPEPERRVPSAEEIKSVEGEIKLEVYHPESLKEGETDIKDAFLGSEKAEDDNDAVPFETTRDFGVPDIDALIQLSQEKQAAPMPGTAPADDAPLRPESVIEPALPAATVSEAEPQPALETDSGNIEIAPRAGSADGEGEIMKIEKENAGKEEPSKPIDAIESSSSGPAEPTKQAPQLSEGGTAAVDSRIERSSPQEFTLRASEPALKEQGLVIEQTGSVFNSNPPAAAAGDADKTTVIPPPPVRPEDEKTVIYEAGANPGVVSRGRTDLGALAGRPVPDGIPPERVRTVAFLYAQEDASLCADMLAELDAICLKSTSKPIFIKRGFVQACAPGVSGPVYMQKVADAGAMGLILVGNVPQDNVYELENVFIAGGVFFRHFPQEAISHSSALELVTELILK